MFFRRSGVIAPFVLASTLLGSPERMDKYIKQGDLPGVRGLLDAGYPVDFRDPARRGATPLACAIQFARGDAAHVEIVRLLVERGADVNVEYRYWWGTALHEAVRADTAVAPAIVRVLLDAGAEPNRKGYRGRTPLISTLQPVNRELIDGDIVSQLLEAGADVHARDPLGRTALHHAVSTTHSGHTSVAVVQLLLDAGADLNAPDMIGWSPLAFCVADGDIVLLQLLLRRPEAILGFRTPDGHDLLMLAANSNEPLALARRGRQILRLEQSQSSPDDRVLLAGRQRLNGSAVGLFSAAADAESPSGKLAVLLRHGAGSLDNVASDGATLEGILSTRTDPEAILMKGLIQAARSAPSGLGITRSYKDCLETWPKAPADESLRLMLR